MYNPERQYRCTIIRGKSQSEMDDLLPAYAYILSEICPCTENEFINKFDTLLAPYLPTNKRDKKTLANHRTEIVGKLFGMYFKDPYGMVFISERTLKFINDSDQPAFFKDVCFKMQFPNGMQKINTINERIKNKINIRMYSFLIKTLLYARNAGIELTKKQIGYYLLNSLDVLQGIANPLEVITFIEEDRKHGIERIIKTPGKATSYDYQHINEQINYLELSNLIIEGEKGIIYLNMNEEETLNIFADNWNIPPEFDVYAYNLNNENERKKMLLDWQIYFSKISSESDKFRTTNKALGIHLDDTEQKKKAKETTVELGDEGEDFVYKYEKERVRKFNTRLANKVLPMGRTKGLGYDIQSVIAEAGPLSEFVKYIEVKSTRRVTEPDINEENWSDVVNITRNEWIAAQQHKEYYYIYRVYFTRNKVVIHVIKDIYKKEKEGKVMVTPMTYRLDYYETSIDNVIGV